VTPPPFVVFALPRSRTAWLARFLTYGDWQCGHDEARHCRSLDDAASWLAQPCTGTVETAVAPFWRLLRPDIRVVTLRRPLPQIVASMRRTGVAFEDAPMMAILRAVERKLDQIEARLPSVLAVTYDDLATEAGCARVFEHCLGLPHDHTWWTACAPVNIQVNFGHVVRYFIAHRSQLEKLAKTAKHRCLAAMTREPRDIDGVTFQREPFRQFWRDAAPLLAEHAVEAGEAPDYPASLNVPLMEMLDDGGMLQTITARQNGRMFGYLMTIVEPTLEDRNTIQGWHSIFYASPDMPGIGMRLQRAAVDALRERGAKQIIMRAGHRASGPRLGTFYRRLGAEDIGNLYRLELS
jgi:GNAT superfamily N-acetyltransferase